jgi:type I restriction enzyme S subunit
MKCKLGDICLKITSGGTPKSTNSSYYGGNIPWLRTQEVNFIDIERTEMHITKEGYDNSSAKWIPTNSVIVAMYGATAGKCAISRIPLTTNQACCNLIIDDNKADYRYVYYRLKQNYENLLRLANGGAQQNLSARIISDYEIEIPSLVEQRSIADTLSVLDDKIAVNKKINHHLEQMAQAIFKAWFVDNTADNWDNVSLGTITHEIRTKVKERKLQVLSAVRTGNLVLSEDYFTKQVYSKDIGKYIVVEPNDFAYNPARINIGSIGINGFDFAGCVSPVYVVFRAEPEYHNFLSFFLRSPNFQEEVRVRASGSVRQSLNYGDFALIQVTYPPIDIVREFNYQYEGILETIQQIDIENAFLAETRDSLLPRLMSGELSVAGLVGGK